MATHPEAFPADPALPQLAIASDPSRMCELFRQHLRPLAGQAYPQDRRLPALPLLLGGPPPDLERLLLTALGPGDWQAVAWKVEPARYRAGLAAVLRYELEACEAASGRRAVRRFFVKVYRKG